MSGRLTAIASIAEQRGPDPGELRITRLRALRGPNYWRLAPVIACDLSPSLVRIAEDRLAGTSAQVVLGDAEAVAVREGPFDLIFSRHGVMFFPDPVEAFRTLRSSASISSTMSPPGMTRSMKNTSTATPRRVGIISRIRFIV